MGRIVLVVGTDTGVGKTVVACGIALALPGRVVAVKPVESGCDGAAVEDGALLAGATGQESPRAALTRLREAVAPPVAADRSGTPLDPAFWVDEIRRRAEGADWMVVEGAGGLLSPLTWDFSALDLAWELDAEVLVVGADRLGTLNHVLLTLRALEGCRVPGVVLSAPADPDGSTGSNADALARVRPELRVTTLPRLSDPASAPLPEVAGWMCP